MNAATFCLEAIRRVAQYGLSCYNRAKSAGATGDASFTSGATRETCPCMFGLSGAHHFLGGFVWVSQ